MSKQLSIILIISTVILALMVFGSFGQEPLLPEGCVCATTDDLNPVCGNNGVTYPNLGMLQCADRCHKYSIHFMHRGPCKT